MLKVYIAGPISKGNQFQNVARGIRVGSEVMRMGACPFVPHLSALWDMVDGDLSSIQYDTWLAMDFEWIKCCDCLLRLPGESKGADLEVEFALQQGVPVFESISDLAGFVHLMNGDKDGDCNEAEETLIQLS